MSSTPAPLHSRLEELTLRDRHRLRRRLDGLNGKSEQARQKALAGIEADVATAEQRVRSRRENVPKVRYPAELPVSQRADDLAQAIRENQVVIVAGETGSGKTTQLPKICLDIGRGVHGMIGHTQPRRIAARTVAERIAGELGTELGDVVGWQIRFTERVGENTLVKVMTDGILLAEIQRDRMLRAYDTLIIDEAHERSLNVDFLLGYLKRLLPRRPELKVVITSATIDPERFSQHFDGAPIVEVSGRTYPVEVRYRPIVDPDEPGADKDRDQVQAICDAVTELSAEAPGDVLVFLSGEREIRDAADALAAVKFPPAAPSPSAPGELRNTEILPLYSRLSSAEQHRVFQPHRGRRIVLATNVAETSLTVPGIKYVVDPGTARISRYSHRLKVQRLPIEPISQASANQRKGRCGRTSDGICIRLYAEDDFDARPEFTDPEILRTNLASVLLQMAAAELGDIADYPFLEPPDRRQVADGVNLLRELGALDGDKLTAVGRQLARLPVDPRMARMVVEGKRNGCLHEVLVIAAALSIQDPRERPAEQQQAADAQHARFADPTSDFLGYLNLWDYLREQQRELSSSRFRKLCKREYLNYLRVREWQDLYAQLRDTAKQVGISAGKRSDERADYQRIHTSLLAGMLSHIGLKDTVTSPGGRPPGPPGASGGSSRDFLGARGARFAVFPGSALFRKTPRWVMAAELVETTKLWGRICAKIEPEWIESLGGHLVKRNYAEPHWERKQGAVMASETVTLYGVPLVAGRKVNFARVDPPLCRELFIRHALVDGDWDTRHAFFHANRELLAEVEELEHRARRRDILVDDQQLFEFYDERVPPDVVSARHFDAWWKQARREQPERLDFDPSMLVNEGVDDVSAADYPTSWRQGELEFPLTYQFEPGADADGVTVHVPLAVLNQVGDSGFDRLVPGLREELVTALIKSLPKQLRRELVPAPDTAKAVLERLEAQGGPLTEALAEELHALRAVDIPADAWDPANLPDHLRMTFRVLDDRGRPLGEGKDLRELQRRLAPRVQTAITRAAAKVERRGLTSWELESLPREFEGSSSGSGPSVQGYPALTDAGEAVDVRVYASPGEQQAAMWRGTRRLVLLAVPSPRKLLRQSLTSTAKLQLAQNPHGSVAGLLDDCVNCAADKLIADAGGPAWDADGFARLTAAVRAGLGPTVVDTVERVRRVLVAWRAAEARKATFQAPNARKVAFPAPLGPALADVDEQLSGLVYDGFVADTGFARLPDVERYLRAVERRLEKLPQDPQRDAQRMQVVQELSDEYRELLAAMPPGHDPSPQLRELRWMLEELRVSFFAQTLGTAYPVSEKRVIRAIDALAG